GVQDNEVCLLPDLERAEELCLLHGSRTALRCVFEHVFRLGPEAGVRVIARDSFRQQGDSHDLEQVVGVVVTISVASSPSRRLVGWMARRAELGNPKSSLKPRARVAARWAWQLMRPGKRAFPRPS